jgi:hypothetical protein
MKQQMPSYQLSKQGIAFSFLTLTFAYVFTFGVHLAARYAHGHAYYMSYDTIVIFFCIAYFNAVVGYLSCIWLGDNNWLKEKIDSFCEWLCCCGMCCKQRTVYFTVSGDVHDAKETYPDEHAAMIIDEEGGSSSK